MAVEGRDPLRIALHVLLYVGIGFGSALFVGPLLLWLGGELLGAAGSDLVCAIFVNWLTLRMFTTVRLADLGLWWHRASADNLALGLFGVGSSRVDLQACKLEYSIVSPK